MENREKRKSALFEKLNENGKIAIKDQIIKDNLVGEKWNNLLLIRIGAKDRKFTKVDFSFTHFENCYFRNIVFDSCTFTGCKFSDSNFRGSTFPGSRFDYASFNRTIIEDDILVHHDASRNNLMLEFARSLRVNYQSLGNAAAANRAMKIELKATERHLLQAWNSDEVYYRRKYSGCLRFSMFLKWCQFILEKMIWGNGESIKNFIITGFVLLFILTIFHAFVFQGTSFENIGEEFLAVLPVVWGITKPNFYPIWYLTLITVGRFIYFALFISVIIKRYNRR